MAAAQSTRLVLTAAGLVVAVGLTAASASSQGMRPAALEAEVQLMTAGPGTLTISPAGGGRESATCEVDAQEYQVPPRASSTGTTIACRCADSMST